MRMSNGKIMVLITKRALSLPSLWCLVPVHGTMAAGLDCAAEAILKKVPNGNSGSLKHSCF